MIFFNRLSLKNKIIGIILVTTFIVVAAGFGFIIFIQQKNARQALIEKSITESGLISEYCVIYLVFEDKEGAEQILKSTQALKTVSAAVLYDVNDELFAEYLVDSVAPVFPGRKADIWVNTEKKDKIEIINSVYYQNQFYGTLMLTITTKALRAAFYNYLKGLLLLGVFLLLLAYGIAVNLQKVLSQPLLKLVEATRRVSKGIYTEKLTYRGTDEFSVLFEGFNGMVAQIRKREEELKEKAVFIDRIIDYSAVSTWISDDRGYAIRANQASLDFFGTTRKEIIGKYNIFKDKGIINSASGQEVEKVYKEGKVLNLILDYNLANAGHVRVKNPENKIINSIFTPIQDQRGKVVNVIVQTIDLTEVKRAENNLRKLKENLENEVSVRTLELKEQVEKLDRSRRAMLFMVEDLNNVTAKLKEEQKKLQFSNKELEAFTYSVSHDLRAPLRAINGYAKFLLEDYEDKLDEEGKRFVNTIRKNATRMDQLISHLLNLSRVNRAKMNMSRVNMHRCVTEVLDEMVDEQIKKDYTIEIGDLPSASCDLSLIKQVWENLLSNAIKYSSRSETKKIEIFGEAKNGKVYYTVRDYGTGFNKKYTDKVFGIFQRLHKESEYEGTGVGLAIVQRLVTRHGGEITAEGETGKGASFCFSLPSGEH